MPTIICARRRASTWRFMNAPAPTFTSSTRASSPTASFFDMMDDAISGMDSTVAVASRSEYSLPSAGATSGVCPMKASLCLSQLLAKFVDGQVGAKSGNRFELVQRPAGVAQRAARNHRHHDTGRGRHGRRDEAGFIAHAAGRMLIHFQAGHRRQVHGSRRRCSHAFGEGA
jgi:hypothetical protein